MRKGIVAYWGSDIRKIRKLVEELPEGVLRTKIKVLLNKGRSKPLPYQKIQALHADITNLLEKTAIPDQIYDYISANFAEIDRTLQQGAEGDRASGENSHT